MLTTYFFSLRRFVQRQAQAKHEIEVALEARMRAEEAEKRVLAELWRSNRELQDFAFVASHDLQEPLRKILAFGDRLRIKSEGQLSADGKDYLERMLSAASRMQKLIDDLLVFSRVTTKARPFTQVDLNLVLEDVLETLDHRIESQRARVTVDALPKIEADSVQMHQLFQNLLGNSFKFQKDGQVPEVRVSAQNSGSQVVVTVRDNGIGFEPQFAEKIFTVFQRLHGRGDYEGSGIGLAICRKIVERHGGHIEARSEPNRWAEFMITLPYKQHNQP
jgi:light-regulated signal transduction histidine kinase (bacteriophytochrome)